MSKDALPLRRLLGTVLVVISMGNADGASYQTVNFSVTAEKAQVAERVGLAAEKYRRQLAIFWLGKPLPNWSRPCKISVNEGALGAGGQTTFQFSGGEVLNWRMQVQGSLERILDSVLPHEVNHTIFACHFRRPLPRWADEGAATLFEHRSEQLKQLALLNEVVKNHRELISLRDLLSMKEYPRGQRAMLTLYAQGYALADFLVQQKGRYAYLRFISDGERSGWENAIRGNFDHEGIESLEKNWRGWVLAGMPKLTEPREQMLVAKPDLPSATEIERRQGADRNPEGRPSARRRQISGPEAVVRSQSPDVPSAESRSGDIRASESDGSRQRPSTRSEGKPGRRDSTIQAPQPVIAPTSSFRFEDGTRRKTESSGIESKSASASAREEDPGTLWHGGELFEPTRSRSAEAVSVETALFSFDQELLPRERKKESGTTPQWAGFPGQKKLF